MVDFVEEVEEQLRAERYADLAQRYLPWFAAAVIATVIGWLGVWGYNSWRDRDIGTASIAYNAGITALASGDQNGAFNAFAGVARGGPAAYRTLALMQEGNIRAAGGQAQEASTFFDQAAKAAPNAVLRDLAGLRAAQTLMDTVPLAEIEPRLKALIGDKKPYTLEAREALAMARLQAGMTQQARNEFNALSLTLGVSPDMRARARGAIALIDSGQGAVVGQVVRAAATLPPPAGPTVGGLPGGFASGASADAQDASGAAAPDSAPTPAGNAQ